MAKVYIVVQMSRNQDVNAIAKSPWTWYRLSGVFASLSDAKLAARDSVLDVGFDCACVISRELVVSTCLEHIVQDRKPVSRYDLPCLMEDTDAIIKDITTEGEAVLQLEDTMKGGV